ACTAVRSTDHFVLTSVLVTFLSAPPSLLLFFLSMLPPPPRSTLFPYTTLFRSLSRLVMSESRFRNSFRHSPVFDSLSPLNPYSRSEEHTSELQSRFDLVCRLLLEKKKQKKKNRQ